MTNAISLCFFYFFLTICSFAQVPKVSSGTIRQFPNFTSKFVGSRNIDVWLPSTYNTKSSYAVLYMQDGKALFDSTIMWNRQEWGVDETMTFLEKNGQIKQCIVVGIWNSEATRQSEYFPQKAFQLLSGKEQENFYKTKIGERQLLVGEVKSDSYLEFLVKELKPFIDSTFSTFRDANNTFVGGSSYGGLISLYAICEYPNVFSRAVCLSTHWPGVTAAVDNPIPLAIMKYLDGNLPDAKSHKLYFDYGNKTLDSLYRPYQQQVDKILESKGYNSKNWMTKEFIGADHTEKSWSKRLAIPFTFLLGIKE